MPTGLSASPLYYTFEGEIRTVDGTFELQGTPLEYVVEIDFDKPGYSIHHDGSVYYSDDDYYAALLTNTFYSSDDPGEYVIRYLTNNGYFEHFDVYYGELLLNDPDTGTYFTVSRGGSVFDNAEEIWIQYWEVGDIFGGIEIVDDGINDFAMRSNLILTNISSINPLSPIPEPTSLALLSTGLIGLLCLKKRKAPLK